MTEDFVPKTSELQIIFWHLQKEDFDWGFLKLLESITEVGKVIKDKFIESFEKWYKGENVFTIVAVDLSLDLIVGTGTVMLEQKFTRNCSLVGHIEDIATLKSHEGNGIGK